MGGSLATPSDRRTLICLVRHGQMPLNESGVLRGLLDPLLDDAGGITPHPVAAGCARMQGPAARPAPGFTPRHAAAA